MNRQAAAIVKAGRIDRAMQMLKQSHAEAAKAYRELIDHEPEAAAAIARAMMQNESAQKIVEAA